MAEVRLEGASAWMEVEEPGADAAATLGEPVLTHVAIGALGDIVALVREGCELIGWICLLYSMYV